MASLFYSFLTTKVDYKSSSLLVVYTTATVPISEVITFCYQMMLYNVDWETPFLRAIKKKK